MSRLLAAAFLALALTPGCIQINVGTAPTTSPTTESSAPAPPPEPEFEVDFTWTPANPTVRDTVVFQATVRNLGDRTIDTWHWDWGDGTAGSGPKASHKWDKAVLEGYDVTLRVLASDGQHEVSQVVFVTG